MWKLPNASQGSGGVILHTFSPIDSTGTKGVVELHGDVVVGMQLTWIDAQDVSQMGLSQVAALLKERARVGKTLTSHTVPRDDTSANTPAAASVAVVSEAVVEATASARTDATATAGSAAVEAAASMNIHTCTAPVWRLQRIARRLEGLWPCTYTPAPTRARAHMRTHARIRMQAYARTHTHARTHTCAVLTPGTGPLEGRPPLLRRQD